MRWRAAISDVTTVPLSLDKASPVMGRDSQASFRQLRAVPPSLWSAPTATVKSKSCPCFAVRADPFRSAPVADLVARVDIPWSRFQLDNGLTVIVHEDRKAPVVAVSIWYNSSGEFV